MADAILIISLFACLILRAAYTIVIKIFGYQFWYRRVYLYSPSWKFARWVKLTLSGKTHGDCHHLTYKHIFWEWLFPNDLQVLTRKEHVKRHGYNH